MALYATYSPQLRIELVVSIRGLGQEISDMICQLAEYLEGLVTSMDPEAQDLEHAREWVNRILGKMKEFCLRVALAVESSIGEAIKAFSSAKDKILKAVEMAKQRAAGLMDGARSSIYEAWFWEFWIEHLRGLVLGVLGQTLVLWGEEAEKEETDEGYEAEDDIDSKADEPATKRIRLA